MFVVVNKNGGEKKICHLIKDLRRGILNKVPTKNPLYLREIKRNRGYC
jgi:hypothetical protein